MILPIFYQFFIYWGNSGLLSSFSVDSDSIMLGKIILINLIQRLWLLQLIRSIYFFKDFIYFRERESTQAGGRAAGEGEADLWLSWEPEAKRYSIPGPWDHWRQTLHQGTQPPMIIIIINKVTEHFPCTGIARVLYSFARIMWLSPNYSPIRWEPSIPLLQEGKLRLT